MQDRMKTRKHYARHSIESSSLRVAQVAAKTLTTGQCSVSALPGTIFREATPSESKTENDARVVLLSRLASRLLSIFRSARSASRRKQIGNLLGAAPVT
jgi:hypothetical protein